MNKANRLYELLPAIYRVVDTEEGYSLRALLQVIAEQVNIVEDDITRLYDNWFIETCDDWVVPYIGDLIGFQPVHEAGEPGDPRTAQAHARNKILIPRREVANVISYRRRKGTLALLEELSKNVAGWPARAVEFYKLLGWTQHLNHPRLRRGQPANLIDGQILDLLDSPFAKTTHTVDVRRINSHRSRGYFDIGSVGLFVWRLKTYSVTDTPAYCIEEEGPECYTFNALGHDTPVYNRAQPEPSPTHIAGVLNLPTPIRRRPFEDRTVKRTPSKPRHASVDYYDRSLRICLPERSGQQFKLKEIAREFVIPANLSDWHKFRPARGFVAVDPVLGRIVFPSNQKPRHGVVVSYQYAFSADIGGGEYERPLSEATDAQIFRVGKNEMLKTIQAAMQAWENQEPKPRAAVIELQDSDVYTEQLNVNLAEGEYLQVRAAQRKRPVLRLLDYLASLPDALAIQGKKGSRFILDGLTIGGRGLQINGPEEAAADDDSMIAPSRAIENDLCDVTIRHCTLVPGWSLACDCEPQRPNDPSIELEYSRAKVRIEHSIIGAITVEARERASEPQEIVIADSIVDATSEDRVALGSSRGAVAYVALTIARSTVIGRVQTHSIELAENTIFNGLVTVARRGRGCVRFCYVPEDSRTPRRYQCQPDLVKQAVMEDTDIASGSKTVAKEQESDRVRPVFNSLRYGTPTYCQLADRCAEEITRGADDESEMGVFHDLFQPQRAANLRARLDEFTPAGMDAGIVYAN
ncbi:MAG TPA: hypothetical protein VJ875_12080 [Pyrinomonadaceae bacterium]|nr:hypothetical protein [Pyrinomonadaceae bacterium]